MSAADDFAEWAEEVGNPDVPIGDVSDVTTVRVGDKVMNVGVPVPAGLNGEWMAEALRESVARAGSAAAYPILGTFCRQMDGRSDD